MLPGQAGPHGLCAKRFLRAKLPGQAGPGLDARRQLFKSSQFVAELPRSAPGVPRLGWQPSRGPGC
eukprot:7678980-Karenia_brevis.AAC.1